MGIPCGVEGYGPSSAGCHQVVVLFMHLYVGAKFQVAMFEIVNTLASYNGTGTERVRDAIASWKAVEPEDAGIHHLDNQLGGHVLKAQGCIDTVVMLFDGMDVAFNVTNVFIIQCSIESDTHGGEIGMEGLKFTVHNEMLHFHTASLVDGVDTSSSSNQSVHFHITEYLNSAKFDVAGDGDQEGDLVDVHDVASKLHMMSLFHGMGGDIDRSDAYSIVGRLLKSLPFERANIRAKDVFCIQDVCMGDWAVGQQIAVDNM